MPGVGGIGCHQPAKFLFRAAPGLADFARDNCRQGSGDTAGQNDAQQQDLAKVRAGPDIIRQPVQPASHRFGQRVIFLHHRQKEHGGIKRPLIWLVQQGLFIGILWG